MKSLPSEENLAQVVISDPHYQSMFLSCMDEGGMAIPAFYDMEIKEILDTPIALLTSIDSPEDYKTLVAAIGLVKICKQRTAIIRHHLKGLSYQWGKLLRQATKYIETKYFAQLANVRVETKKAIITNALEPITQKVEQVDYLVSCADLAQKHLDDLNWAVKNSSDLVSAYFAAIRTVSPSSLVHEI